MNVHAIANSAIKAVNKNEDVLLLIAMGQRNVMGIVFPEYLEPVTISAQVQSESDAALQHIAEANQTAIVRKFYMNADAVQPPSGLVRQKERTGDLIKRADGTWWLVTAVPDDFSASSGWVSLRGILQTIAPDLKTQAWYEDYINAHGTI